MHSAVPPPFRAAEEVAMSWIPFLTYTVTTSITPGPNTIMTFSTASRVGFRRALPFCFGVWLGFSCIMLLSTLFCSAMQAYLPMLRLPMLIAGALYLLYLAWHTYKSTGDIAAQEDSGNFRKGLLLQFVNVKVYINCLMSLQGYILPAYERQFWPLAGFVLLVPALSFATLMLWAGFGTAMSRFLSRHRKAANTVFALLLVYCAVALFL